jgi:hypothetical protein
MSAGRVTYVLRRLTKQRRFSSNSRLRTIFVIIVGRRNDIRACVVPLPFGIMIMGSL